MPIAHTSHAALDRVTVWLEKGKWLGEPHYPLLSTIAVIAGINQTKEGSSSARVSSNWNAQHQSSKKRLQKIGPILIGGFS